MGVAAAERCAPGVVVYRSRQWAASDRNRASTGWRLLGEAAGPGARYSGCSHWSWPPPPPGTWLLCAAASARSANATSGRTCRVRGGSQGGGVGSRELAGGRSSCGRDRRGSGGVREPPATNPRQRFRGALWREALTAGRPVAHGTPPLSGLVARGETCKRPGSELNL